MKTAETKSEYQLIIDEFTGYFMKWKNMFGAMGWYQMPEEYIKVFITKIVRESQQVASQNQQIELPTNEKIENRAIISAKVRISVDKNNEVYPSDEDYYEGYKLGFKNGCEFLKDLIKQKYDTRRKIAKSTK